MKEITKAKFINTWASEWDERTGWKVSEEYHKQFSEQLEYLINQEAEKRIAERMPSLTEVLTLGEKSSKIKLSEREEVFIKMTYNVLCSRLTQKTEGGRE